MLLSEDDLLREKRLRGLRMELELELEMEMEMEW